MRTRPRSALARAVPIRSAIAPTQGAVSDLADQGLNETVLPPLRRARIDLQREDLPPDECAKPALQFGLRLPSHGGKRPQGKRLAEHRSILEESPVSRLEG